eukprot:TRINITY_DN25389_c0_g1_i4.p4 TRINITY_DN25389_c0_g1~~TRINITY_DN25389_c0_g1_i4.p4  ORF type:complete len:183 (+),score=2.56 TRINITY_DN25389_c0_g1_i4:1-549(+)
MNSIDSLKGCPIRESSDLKSIHTKQYFQPPKSHKTQTKIFTTTTIYDNNLEHYFASFKMRSLVLHIKCTKNILNSNICVKTTTLFYDFNRKYLYQINYAKSNTRKQYLQKKNSNNIIDIFYCFLKKKLSNNNFMSMQRKQAYNNFPNEKNRKITVRKPIQKQINRNQKKVNTEKYYSKQYIT